MWKDYAVRGMGFVPSTHRIIGLVVASLALSAGSVWAQGTLDLPLETGEPATSLPPPPKATVKVKPPATGRASGRLGTLPLPSRGTPTRTPVRANPQPAPKVLAQLGFVLPDKLEVRVSPESGARMLSVVQKGTHLAVVKEGFDHWGVLMVNNTVGWVPKSALELIDYRTEVALAAPEPPPQSQPEGDSEAGYPGAAIADPRIESIMREAFTYLGVPYVWAGNTRNGLDCSAFVKNVFSTMGVKLPRHSGDQLTVGRPVQGPDLRAGDRLYFDMKSAGRINHTGIYLGNGYFIHASSNQRKVGVDSLFKKNYYRGLVAARRDFE